MTGRWIVGAAVTCGAVGLVALWSGSGQARGDAGKGAPVLVAGEGRAVASAHDAPSLVAEAAEDLFHAGGTATALLARGVLMHPDRFHAAAARLVPDAVSEKLALFVKVTARAMRDEATATEVRTQLAFDPRLAGSSIKVGAFDGRVLLDGDVGDPEGAASAVRDALRCNGVQDVQARLDWPARGAD
jgi:hypothetical protein